MENDIVQALNGINSPFANFVRMEKKTAELMESTGVNVPGITSAAAQVATLDEIVDKWREVERRILSTEQLLDDYSRFAINQHKGIQESIGAGRNDDAL